MIKDQHTEGDIPAVKDNNESFDTDFSTQVKKPIASPYFTENVTTVTTIEKENEQEELDGIEETHFRDAIYTRGYVEYRTQKMIAELLLPLGEWAEQSSSLEYNVIYIAHIKEILNKYVQYLGHRNENRIFFGLLNLVFEGMRWKDLSDSQIRVLYSALSNFKDKNINFDNLTGFEKALYKANIGNMDLEEDDEEETKR